MPGAVPEDFMMNTRRELLSALSALSTLTWGAPACAAFGPGADTLHALNRLAYGPRPGDLERWAGRSWPEWVEAQLGPPEPLPAGLAQRLAALPQGLPARSERLRAFRAAERRAGSGETSERRTLVQGAYHEAAEARLARALWSPNPLEERLVEFWFNHFNVFIGKGPCRVLVGDYEASAIRPYVLGRFRELLGATAQHPAMLVYLDNAQSGAGGGLNENYARELMELHTLGVDGGYTQQDVTELARVLTGWSVDPRDGRFRFASRRHDEGAKTWLGERVPARGQAQGEWALDRLAEHPATARRIAHKLAQHFIADQPEPELVQATAQVFTRSGGDLRASTRALLLHPLARPEAVRGTQFKTPYRFVLSLLRACDARPAPGEGWQPVLGALRQLGQPLFGCVTPDGYKTTREAWLDPEALARRVDIAARLAQRLRPDPGELLQTLGDGIGAATRAALQREPERLRAALLLGAPDFQNT
jgi:uncharacterized protein (DUF1800 family)